MLMEKMWKTYKLTLSTVCPHLSKVYLQRFSPDLDAPLSEDASSHLTVVQKSLRDFITLMDDLNNLPSQTPALNELPIPGMMCCAKYSLDDRWYRGLVVKSYPASNTVLIFYVDYGNSEIISLQGYVMKRCYLPILEIHVYKHYQAQKDTNTTHQDSRYIYVAKSSANGVAGNIRLIMILISFCAWWCL